MTPRTEAGKRLAQRYTMGLVQRGENNSWAECEELANTEVVLVEAQSANLLLSDETLRRATEEWVELFNAYRAGEDLQAVFDRHISEASERIRATLAEPSTPTSDPSG